MLRDASQQQVVEKFSFIYTLTLSSAKNCAVGKVEALQTPPRNPDSYATNHREKLASPETANSTKSNNSQLASASSSPLAAASSSLISTIAPQWYQTPSPDDSGSLKLSEIIRFSAAENEMEIEDFSGSSPNYWGKILFSVALGYLMVAVWWLFGHRSGQFIAMLRGKQQIILSQSDAEFIDYMERALAAIERQPQTSEQEDNKIAQEPNSVVYVPVYTPAPSTPAVPQITTLPTNYVTNQNSATIPPAITQSTTPTSPPPPSVVKIPEPPPLPTATPMPKPEAAIATATTPAIKHTLIGILDLGEKSAALFKVNKRTERIWLGQEIKNSGWILESIDAQKAIISRQGETRSLSVGETF